MCASSALVNSMVPVWESPKAILTVFDVARNVRIPVPTRFPAIFISLFVEKVRAFAPAFCVPLTLMIPVFVRI